MILIRLLKLTLLVVLFSTVLSDMRDGRIPNVCVLIIFVIGIIFKALPMLSTGICILTVQKIGMWAIEEVIVFIFLFPFFSMGSLGAGDLKLILATASGTSNPVIFTFVIFAFGSVMAIWKMFRNRKDIKGRFWEIKENLMVMFRTGRVLPVAEDISFKGNKRYVIRMSIPVFAAFLFYNLLFLVERVF